MDPPSISWDTFYQLHQWLPWAHPLEINEVKLDGYLTDHHPVFDSVLFADFGYGSLLLTGSANPGLRLSDLIYHLGGGDGRRSGRVGVLRAPLPRHASAVRDSAFGTAASALASAEMRFSFGHWNGVSAMSRCI